MEPCRTRRGRNAPSPRYVGLGRRWNIKLLSPRPASTRLGANGKSCLQGEERGLGGLGGGADGGKDGLGRVKIVFLIWPPGRGPRDQGEWNQEREDGSKQEGGWWTMVMDDGMMG